jgi:hypothetical protein
MPRGYVYILINASMPGLVKIGQTSHAPEDRARKLSQDTGVPVPYMVAYEEELVYYEEAEQEIHKRLSRSRLSRNREFFSIPVRDAIQVVREVAREYRKREEEERQRLDEEHRKQEEQERRKRQQEGQGKREDDRSDLGELGDEGGLEPDYLSGLDESGPWQKSPAMFATIFACLVVVLIICFCLCSGLAEDQNKQRAPRSSSPKPFAPARLRQRGGDKAFITARSAAAAPHPSPTPTAATPPPP